MWIVRGIILLIGVVGLVWLGTENAGTKVTFRFFTLTWYDIELNLILVMTFIAGIIIWAIGAWVREAQLVLALMKERKLNRKLQEELGDLRNLPLDEEPPGVPD